LIKKTRLWRCYLAYRYRSKSCEGSSMAMKTRRFDAPSYDDILDQDTKDVPAYLRQDVVPDIGVEPVPASNYTDPEFFRREMTEVWARCWQMVCREEDIPNVGDHVVYDVGPHSYIIVRSATDTIKALQNICLHRGRKLATKHGCFKHFRCRFHGFEWNLDGSFKYNPIAWDFPHWEGKDMRLGEARTATWGGFVFMNPDPGAPSFQEVIKPIPEHFARYPLEDMYTALCVHKVFPANWKVVAEAFMESHHSVATHPQFMPYLADANSKYDIFSPFVSRQITALGVPSPFVERASFTETDILRAMMDSSGRSHGGEEPEEVLSVPEGWTARAYAAELNRQALAAEDGYDYADFSDAEMLDPVLYNLFPNFSVWAGCALNLVYRWLPIDVDNTVMEIMVLKRVPKNSSRPRPAHIQRLDADQPCASVEELGALGGVFDQDMANLPHVQDGLKAGGPDFPVHFSEYTEMRIRQLHLTNASMMR
jgi:phenylpropionate dioxygenase-like ring-hydroxylating dioxygenase large terminal subunit